MAIFLPFGNQIYILTDIELTVKVNAKFDSKILTFDQVIS